jgi:hypothetical protein
MHVPRVKSNHILFSHPTIVYTVPFAVKGIFSFPIANDVQNNIGGNTQHDDARIIKILSRARNGSYSAF